MVNFCFVFYFHGSFHVMQHYIYSRWVYPMEKRHPLRAGAPVRTRGWLVYTRVVTLHARGRLLQNINYKFKVLWWHNQLCFKLEQLEGRRSWKGVTIIWWWWVLEVFNKKINIYQRDFFSPSQSLNALVLLELLIYMILCFLHRCI